MSDSVLLSANELKTKLSTFQDVFLNVNIEAKILKKTLEKSLENDFPAKHRFIRKCLIAMSKCEEKSIIAGFFTATGKYIAMERMLSVNLDEMDLNSLKILLFELLERYKRYKADRLILIHHRLVDEATLSAEDRWLFKHLKMHLWQQTDYFVNANNNCLFLDLEV